MIAIDMLPISFVEGEGFKSLCKYLVPYYKVPSRGTIMNRLNLLYNLEKTKLLEKLANLNYCALTTDCWTSRNNESYITVTCHGISNDWSALSYNLATEIMPDRHTAEHLREKIEEIMEAFNLMSKVVGIVHDNAANIVAAVRSMKEESICCFAHTLQLIINNSLNRTQVNEILYKCSLMVGHFKHSPIAEQCLHLKQEQLNLPKHKLIQSVKTRWNTTYYMIERLIEQREAISAVINDRKVTTKTQSHKLGTNEEEWEFLEQLKKLFHPLK